ncbi:hypothetical protein PQ610_03100 [Tardisphaera miroshnichenkoae]
MSTKGNEALVGVLLIILTLMSIGYSDVIMIYDGKVGTAVISQPIIPWITTTPCQGGFSANSAGFGRTVYAYTLETKSGYDLNSILSSVSTAVPGKLSLSLGGNGALTAGNIAAYSGALAVGSPVGVASVVQPYGQISLSKGAYTLQQSLLLSAPVSNKMTLSGTLTYSVPGVAFSYDVDETLIPPSGNVINLLNGNGALPSSYAYQGDNNGNPSSAYPVYYSSSGSSTYWGSASINQPVYEMVSSQAYSAGALFWNENYDGRGNVTIRALTTYSASSNLPSGGIEIYMFLQPSLWAASSIYDDSVPYLASGASGYYKVRSFSPVQGDVMLPESNNNNYLMMQWDPYWQTGATASNATGQFNVWIVTEYWVQTFLGYYFIYYGVSPSSPNLKDSYYGWDGVGSGYFKPSPKDYVCITATYDPTNNYVYAYAVDLKTGQVASLSLSLNGYYSVPGEGSYVFGIGGNTGGSYANWGILLVNYYNA